MYKPIAVLKRPSNTLQPLWRYLSGSRLIQLLESQSLWFAHLPVLSDGLEGALTSRTHDRLLRHFMAQGESLQSAQEHIADYERHNLSFFVNCWHMNSYESYLMWRAYADRGFALQTTFERLQLSLDAYDGEVNGTTVEYRDYERETLPVGNVFTAVTTKDAPYRDEREFRLLLWRPDELGRRDLPRPRGIPVRVDLSALIEKIYVSPTHRQSLNELEKQLIRLGINCQIVSSSIRERCQ